MGFHHANLETSKRHQKLYAALRQKGQMSSLQIARVIRSVCPSTEISALRASLRKNPKDGYRNVLQARSNGLHWYWLSRV